MGGISSTTETDLVKIITNNVRLTLDLWEFSAANCNTFIYASSAATYGNGSQGFVDHDTPEELAKLRPLNAYGWSKHIVDRRIVMDVASGRPAPPRWAGLKFFNVYGSNEGHKAEMRSAIHRMYTLAARGMPIELFRSEDPRYRDGEQSRDFVYVKDCCSVVRLMLSEGSLSGLFNVGTGSARTFADVAHVIFRVLDREPRIEYVDIPDNLRGQYQYYTQADTRKLCARGLAPLFHDIEDGISDYLLTDLAH
jgi:ADP-L-glycero-D-manno-heptose 6-epimerase